MCTVSWLRTPRGYELFCNRDERHTRKAARPPSVRETRGVRFVAPTDGDHGGSWIGVNEAGLALCLLNACGGAQSPTRGVMPADDYRSRGLLLTDLMDCLNVSHVRARLSGADLFRYRPFTLAVLSAHEPALLVHWTDNRKTFDGAGDASMPITSSSYRAAEVTAARRAMFRRMVADRGTVTPEVLREFHEGHAPERGPFSVCMHREDAATVSFSRVKVCDGAAEFTYRPLSPCARSRSVRVELPLRREAVQAR
ncbi:MAG TPA: NRDE family protein [Pyrinomonadaceae bacterium]|nr:NRDE family protein [Pyrinomonadaceae bacterium]